MSTSKVLIIDASEECSLRAAKALMPEGLSVQATASPIKARQLMADNRPDVILVDSSIGADPLVWVEEVQRLNLAAQVIAITDEPDFDQSMDWVAGGVFNVLTRPFSEERLRRQVLAALDSCRAFDLLVGHRLNDEEPAPAVGNLSRSLAEFYRGLTGRLEGPELRTYIMDSVKRLTGARQVELCLVDSLTSSTYCLETHTIIGGPNDAAYPLPPAPVSGMDTVQCRLGYELSAEGRHLGELYLYFAKRSDLTISHRETMMEMVSAIGRAIASVAKYQKAVNLAARDGLTGLYNRRIFNEILKREFAKAQRHNFNLSLLSLDLDHFKSVNDNYGHQTGDLVLKAVADIISDVARATDLPARLGGEEFAIILPHTSQEQALTVAERLKNMLAEHDFNLDGLAFRQTISQGLAGLEHFMVKTPEDMVYWADQALYLAKREGRDTIRAITDLPMTPVMKDGAYAFQ